GDLTRVDAQQAEQAVEEGRLAGSVGADQTDGLARLDVERHAVESGDPAEPLAHAHGLEQRHQSAPPAGTTGGAPSLVAGSSRQRAGSRFSIAASDLRLL